MAVGNGFYLGTTTPVFAWVPEVDYCWNTGASQRELISGATGTKGGANPLTRTGNYAEFDNVTTTGGRTCYVSFPDADVTVPTGDTATWALACTTIDAGSVDHPVFGKEASNGWDGVDGVVFGTGWGTDGPRIGIGGQYWSYSTLALNSSATGRWLTTGEWMIWVFTYTRNSASGFNIWRNTPSYGIQELATASTTNVAIGSNTNTMNVGATNIRSGNHNGKIGCLYAWDTVLSDAEITNLLTHLGQRFF
jgi:hypothetical protein